MSTFSHGLAPGRIALRVYTRFVKRNLIVGVAMVDRLHLAEGGFVELELFHYPSQKVIARRKIARLLPGGKAEAVFPLAGAPSGCCWFRATFTDKHRQTFQVDVLQDKMPPVTPWLGSKAGISHRVPAPWTPIKSRTNAGKIEAQCWGRTYEFSPHSILYRVHASGKSLLAGPVRLTGRVNGRAISWSGEPPRFVGRATDRVILRQELKAVGLILRVRSELEFDGMLRVDCAFSTSKPVRVDSLVLEIPMPAVHAKYLYRFPGKSESSENARALPPGGAAMDFQPFLWLGDEERGLAWFCESDKNWFHECPKKCAEIVRRGRIVLLRLRLVSTPVNLLPAEKKSAETFSATGAGAELPSARGLEYTFGFQATPVKPVENTAWDYRAICLGVEMFTGRNQTPLKPEPSLLDKLAAAGVRTVVIFEYWTDIEAHATTTHHKELKRLVQACHDRGLKALLYFGFLISDIAPEWRDLGKECVVLPKRGYPVYHYLPQPNQSAWQVCLRSPWQDFLIEGIGRAMDEFGVDGVYLDGTELPMACANTLHGCGVIQPDGKIAPTYPLFAVRSAMRRIYHAVKSRRPDGQVNVHNSTCMTMPTLGWATSSWDGEQFQFVPMSKSADVRSLLPLDAFRAEFMGHQWGVPAEFLCYGKPFTYREAWSFCLLHDVPVRPSHIEPDLEIAAGVWKAMDAFGRKESEWHPYWRNSPYVSAHSQNVYVSFYRHPQNGVLAVVSNLGRTRARGSVRFNLRRLGLGKGVSVRDALTGKAARLHQGSLAINFKPLEWKLLWFRDSLSS